MHITACFLDKHEFVTIILCSYPSPSHPALQVAVQTWKTNNENIFFLNVLSNNIVLCVNTIEIVLKSY
jgi:hypothetical protein